MFVYEAGSGETYNLPVEAGKQYAGCLPSANGLVLNANPSVFKVDNALSVIDVKLLKEGTTSPIASITTDLLTTGSTEEGNTKIITVPSGSNTNIEISGKIHNITDSEVAGDDIEGGKTPGTVEISDLSITIDLANTIETGDFSVEVTIRDTSETEPLDPKVITWRAAKTFAYTTTTAPTLGTPTITCNDDTHLNTVSGLSYYGTGTELTLAVNSVVNTCYHATKSDNKLSVITTNIAKAGDSSSTSLKETSVGITSSKPKVSDTVLSYSNVRTISSGIGRVESASVKFAAYKADGSLTSYESATKSMVILSKDTPSDNTHEYFQKENMRVKGGNGTAWNSAESLDSNDGLLVQDGQLMFPSKGKADMNGKTYSTITSGERTFYRLFKPSASTASYSTVEITVSGMGNSFDTNTKIYVWEQGTDETLAYQINKVGTGGIAQAQPVNGKWKFVVPNPGITQSKGFMFKVVMTSASAAIGSITINSAS